MYKCLNCNNEIMWKIDQDAEEFGYENECIVQIFECAYCGAEILMYVPSEKPNNVFDDKYELKEAKNEQNKH